MSSFPGDKKEVISNLQSATIMAIEIDSQLYYLPQVDLITFENTSQLGEALKDGKSVASVEFAGKYIPIYCLSKDFDLLNYIPANRKVCVITGYKERRFAILCDKIKKLSYSEIKFEPVPLCMESHTTPLSSLFLYRKDTGETELGMLLRSQTLFDYLQSDLQFEAA